MRSRLSFSFVDICPSTPRRAWPSPDQSWDPVSTPDSALALPGPPAPAAQNTLADILCPASSNRMRPAMPCRGCSQPVVHLAVAEYVARELRFRPLGPVTQMDRW